MTQPRFTGKDTEAESEPGYEVAMKGLTSDCRSVQPSLALSAFTWLQCGMAGAAPLQSVVNMLALP